MNKILEMLERWTERVRSTWVLSRSHAETDDSHNESWRSFRASQLNKCLYSGSAWGK